MRLPAVLAHASMLGGVQTIGPIGIVLHRWESINRGAGDELSCSGRVATVRRRVSR